MRTASLSATVVLALIAASAASATTFKPVDANLALDLPHGWHAAAPDKGWTWQAEGPGFSGWVFLSVRRAVVANTAFQRSLVAFEQSETRKLGPNVKLHVVKITIDGEPATQISAAGAGTNGELILGFQHAGREYLLVYATSATQLAAERPRFLASIRSLRFLDPEP